MSQTSLPDPKTASDISGLVYGRAFIDVMSRRNFAPTSEKQAAQMLRMGNHLREQAEVEAVKQASAADNVLDQIERHMIGAAAAPALPAGAATLLKESAARWAADPAVYNAALAFGVHRAQSAHQAA